MIIFFVCCFLFLYIVIGSLMMLYMIPLMKRADIAEKTMLEVVLLGTVGWIFCLSEFGEVVKAMKIKKLRENK